MALVCPMWLCTRATCRAGSPILDELIRYKGMPHLREVRSIDTWINPSADENYLICSLEELWERLEQLPERPRDGEYNLLFMDAQEGDLPEHPRLKLLGYDVSDETRTSSLLNCGNWQGELEPIAQRTGENGLMTCLEDAELAQALLPKAWPGDPHSLVRIWAMFEIVPSSSCS